MSPAPEIAKNWPNNVLKIYRLCSEVVDKCNICLLKYERNHGHFELISGNKRGSLIIYAVPTKEGGTAALGRCLLIKSFNSLVHVSRSNCYFHLLFVKQGLAFFTMKGMKCLPA